jgi:hypothetical protein
VREAKYYVAFEPGSRISAEFWRCTAEEAAEAARRWVTEQRPPGNLSVFYLVPMGPDAAPVGPPAILQAGEVKRR